jgi:hypothetical protein
MKSGGACKGVRSADRRIQDIQSEHKEEGGTKAVIG